MMSLISLLRFLFSLSNLVHDVLDLVAQVLVLPPDLVQLGHCLLVGSLYLEQLSGIAPALDLRPVKLSLKSINLLLPLDNNLVEVLGSLLHLHAPGLGVIKLGGHLLNVGLELHLVLLQRGRLAIEVLDSALRLGQSGLELELGRLELLGPGESVLLILLPPHLSLAHRLREHPEGVSLGLALLIQLLPGQVHLVLQVAELAEDEASLLGLVIRDLLGLLQLGAKCGLDLAHHHVVVVKLLDISQKLYILNN